MFDTKIALIVRNDLATWQRLNVVAFLATGIASAAPEMLGKPYIDANGYEYGNMLGQPMLVFEGGFIWSTKSTSQRNRARFNDNSLCTCHVFYRQ